MSPLPQEHLPCWTLWLHADRPVYLLSCVVLAQARILLNPGDPVLLEEFSYSHHVDAHLLQMG